MADGQLLTCDTKTIGAGRKARRVALLCDNRSGVRVAVVPGAGAELASFQVRRGGRWTELLHRALDYDGTPQDGWQGRAPILWPAVGRSYTAAQIARWKKAGERPADFRYTAGGKTLRMPIHGFAMRMPWTLEAYGGGRERAYVTCRLCSSAVSRRIYPWDFDFRVTYELSGGALILGYSLDAAKSNRAVMPFCLGNHVSFKLPFTAKGRFEDCTIRTPCRLSYDVSPLGLFQPTAKGVRLTRPVALADDRFCDAALGGVKAGQAWFELRDATGFGVRVSHSEPGRKGRAPDGNTLFVLWGSRALGYFCPEPWIGRPNGLNDPRGRRRLRPGGHYEWENRFEILH